MSIVSLATSFADTYDNHPRAVRNRRDAIETADARALAPDSASGDKPEIPPPVPNPQGPAVTSPAISADTLKSLAAYVPSEVLTLYLAGIAALAKVSNVQQPVYDALFYGGI